MTERQLCALYRIGYSWLQHPELKEKNLNVLKDFNINLDDCVSGPGFDEMGKTNLEEELTDMHEMGYMDEIINNKKETLEFCRATSMKLNYSLSQEQKHFKGVA